MAVRTIIGDQHTILLKCAVRMMKTFCPAWTIAISHFQKFPGLQKRRKTIQNRRTFFAIQKAKLPDALEGLLQRWHPSHGLGVDFVVYLFVAPRRHQSTFWIHILYFAHHMSLSLFKQHFSLVSTSARHIPCILNVLLKMIQAKESPVQNRAYENLGSLWSQCVRIWCVYSNAPVSSSLLRRRSFGWHGSFCYHRPNPHNILQPTYNGLINCLCSWGLLSTGRGVYRCTCRGTFT